MPPTPRPRGRTTTRPIPHWASVLRARRTALGLAQDELAARSAGLLSQGTVSNLEVGKVHLGDLALTRAAALARALDWTLTDLQTHTGLDLGVTPIAPLSRRTADVYPLQAALTPQRPGLPLTTEFIEDGAPTQLLIVRADTDELDGLSGASIRPGEHAYLDLHDTDPRPGYVYAIEHAGHAHLRRYQRTPLGDAWTAENRARHADLPAHHARVIGRVTRVTSRREPTAQE
ncbi:helix-turn-helix domain-containing protein [Deinococcus maricopensis]|nr:helix-turn-helix domain-containing protein [Deinococcus maricopensis]